MANVKGSDVERKAIGVRVSFWKEVMGHRNKLAFSPKQIFWLQTTYKRKAKVQGNSSGCKGDTRLKEREKANLLQNNVHCFLH